MRKIITIAIFILIFSPSGFGRAKPIVFTDVTVIAMNGTAPQPGMTVVISGNRIIEIGPAEKTKFTGEVQTIDASGKFLIPGLWDMHAHMLYPQSIDRLLSMLVANGITGVRDMNGPMAFDEIKELKRKISSGETLGPRFFTPGQLIDGPGRTGSDLGPQIYPVTTAEEAREAVRTLQAAGMDFIKIYNRVTPELLIAITGEAKRKQVPVAGHVPWGVSAFVASNAGVRSLEHLNNILESCATVGEALREFALNTIVNQQPFTKERIKQFFALRNNVVASYDATLADSLFKTFLKNDTWQCPTLVSNRSVYLSVIDREMFANDDRLKYIPASLKESWFQNQRYPIPSTPEGKRENYQKLVEITAEMHHAGIRFLAGTDFGTPFVYPGFSLHDELAFLVEAGLSPQATLQTATRNPAEFFGMLDSLGTVETGKIADLVLLDANPLENIRHTKKINSVIVNGQFISQDRLQEMLAALELVQR